VVGLGCRRIVCLLLDPSLPVIMYLLAHAWNDIGQMNIYFVIQICSAEKRTFSLSIMEKTRPRRKISRPPSTNHYGWF
jgi:hypothetical protein